jgi:hypothetical protein
MLVFLKVNPSRNKGKSLPPFLRQFVNMVRQRRPWFFSLSWGYSLPRNILFWSKTNDGVKLCFLVYLSFLRPV